MYNQKHILILKINMKKFCAFIAVTNISLLNSFSYFCFGICTSIVSPQKQNDDGCVNTCASERIANFGPAVLKAIEQMGDSFTFEIYDEF